ncbi:MAG TPA: hypothetical protein PKM73_05455 [Verrucomicrobiota bacterium]|nr:hypothetical protein [Verrucomicrobiota bacterium]HNU51326.1 hypothetical protein [Verrucomicrobiota bacterium]
MAELNSPPSPQFHVNALPTLGPALTQTLVDQGLAAADQQEVLAQKVALECLHCGITITGADLQILASPPDPATPDDPRIARLRQGYCARKACPSYYYRLLLEPDPKVDWNRALPHLGVASVPAPSTTSPPPRTSFLATLLHDPRHRRVLYGLAILILLLVVRHFATGGRIPFVHSSPTYTVDPASVP